MEPWRGTLPMCRSWIRDSGRDSEVFVRKQILFLLYNHCLRFTWRWLAVQLWIRLWSIPNGVDNQSQVCTGIMFNLIDEDFHFFIINHEITIPLWEANGDLPTRILIPDIALMLMEVKSYPRILHSSPIRCLIHSMFQATIGRPDILIHEKISEALLVVH